MTRLNGTVAILTGGRRVTDYVQRVLQCAAH
jgi:hypothetical protein